MMNTLLRLPITRRSKPRDRLLGVSIALASVSLAACADENLGTRDLGNTSGLLESVQGNLGTPDRLPLIFDGVLDPFVVGQWLGEADDLFNPGGAGAARPHYVFPSGSTEIRLDLNIVNARPEGTLVFGTGVPPEPQRGVAHPPNLELPWTAFFRLPLELPPLEGFTYDILDRVERSSVDVGTGAGVLALTYDASEQYRSWCGLQPPLLGDGGFDCLGTAGVSDAPSGLCINTHPDDSAEEVACNFAALCLSDLCSCTAEKCYEAPRMSNLWLVRSGDDLLGTFVGTVFDYGTPGRAMPVGTVRFRRESP
jgi:hypothetical protein